MTALTQENLAMERAIEAASAFWGNTAPNPPVGAAVLDKMGRLIAVGAHEKAGLPHAEVKALEKVFQSAEKQIPHTLVVTLEPCCHYGRTPPCTELILSLPIQRVIFGNTDPNPKVAGKGAALLKSRGLEVIGEFMSEKTSPLIRGFRKKMTEGLPWIRVKRAFQGNEISQEAMIPANGQKTFASPENLKLAHEIRKKSDAIVTGLNTVLIDDPEFTVRHVSDHPQKKRLLLVFSKTRELPTAWTERAKANGFFPQIVRSLEECLKILSSSPTIQEVLVEAGPKLSQFFLDQKVWDERIDIFSTKVDYVYRNH